MNRRSSAGWLALAFALAGMPDVPVNAATARERPNVLFILTDDQGWGDAHFAGHPYVKTPNLDRLSHGLRKWRQETQDSLLDLAIARTMVRRPA